MLINCSIIEEVARHCSDEHSNIVTRVHSHVNMIWIKLLAFTSLLLGMGERGGRGPIGTLERIFHSQVPHILGVPFLTHIKEK